MSSESFRIADQLRRAFSGDAWHGSPLRDLLAGVSAEDAASRPLRSAHSIWELVLHIDIYVAAAADATREIPIPHWYGSEKDWPVAEDLSAEAWTQATDRLFRNAEQLAGAIESTDDSSLFSIVPGRDYNFYHLFHGIIQHSLYHGGQIAMLRKANARP